MNVIFIAGPFRGASAWEVECNIRRAEGVAFEAWRAGFAVLCPHTNTRFFDKSLPDAVWLSGDLELLRRCDAVLTVEGWEKSTGTLAEIAEAERLGIPVFYSLAELINRLEGEQ